MKPLVILAVLTLAARAGEPLSPPTPLTPCTESSSDWEFTTALYAPLMGLEGNVGVRGFGPFDVDVPFDKVLEHLDAGLSGAFEARYDRWSITADAIWLKLSATAHPLAASRLTATQEQLTSALSVGYEIYGSESTSLTFAAGAVLNSLDLELELFTPNLPITRRSDSGSHTWVDPFVGLRFLQRLSDRWSFSANGSVGGFGVSSDEYWQVLAGFGYRITEDVSLAVAYRAISVDYHDGGFVYDTVSSGPNVGLIIRF